MKTKLFILFLALASSIVKTFASNTQVNGIWYDFDSSTQTASVTYRGSSYSSYTNEYTDSIVIPSSVTYSGKTYSVTSIGNRAFYYCSGLTSVIIPNSVTSIGDAAFYYCSGLTSVIIPNSVTSIGNYAFSHVNNIAYSGTATGSPWGAKSINGYVEDLLVYSDNSKTMLVGCSSAVTGEIIIPNSVTSIGNKAFYYCPGLTSVTIPNSVTSIGYTAFASCIGLTSVTCLGETPVSLSGGEFFDCSNLNAIYVPCGSLDAYKSSWSSYTSIIKYPSLEYDVQVNVNMAEAGIVNKPLTICIPIIAAVPNYGYHFLQWSDGVTENPRTVEITQDTTFTAEFAKNTYTIVTEVNNSEWGATAGDTTALYLDEIQISATANYGYHFVRWNDNNTSNPRSVILSQDCAFTATFAKNVYSITKVANSTQGSVSGKSSAEYLDEVTLTVNPKYGYHFVQWNDGNTDNPRTFAITNDTTFTAEFALDRTGTCGNDLALTWEYDTIFKTLTISGNGAFEQNMQCGVEARGALTKVVFADGVTSIGASAFSGITTLQTLVLSKDVKKINENAFYNCENMAAIYNYASVPANVYSNTFDGVNKFTCVLYVPEASIDMYKAASVWRDFYYVQAISSEPQGPEIVEGKYPVQYLDKESAELHSELVTLHVPVAPIIEGFKFLYWQPVAQDISTGIIIQAVYEANEPSSAPSVYTNPANPAQKLIRNGNVYILTDDHTYTITGQVVK